MKMVVSPARMSMYHMCAMPVEARRSIVFPGIGVRDGCELTHVCCESKPCFWKSR